MLGHLDHVNVVLVQCTVSRTNVSVLSVQWTMWMYCNNVLHGHYRLIVLCDIRDSDSSFLECEVLLLDR